MQQQSLYEGITAVIKFCNDNRIPETTSKYQLAWKTISMRYAEQNITNYSESFNEELRQEVKARLEEHLVTGFKEERYFFRTLGMLDDYFAGRPFKYSYPLVSRYKVTLDHFYEKRAEDFKSSLHAGRLTIPVLYSIARDFFYYLQIEGIRNLNLVNQDIIYAFLMYEYSTHMGCMGNIMCIMHLICEYLRKKNYDNIPTELLTFALPSSRKKVLPAFNYSDMESIDIGPQSIENILFDLFGPLWISITLRESLH